MKKLFALFLLCLPATAQAQDSILSCTQMWCQEGTTLMLNGGAWKAGDYTFTVTADDKTVTCKGSLPFKTCDGSVTCDGEGVTIGESGCAMPADTHAFHAVMLPQSPAHLAVTVSRADGKSFSYDSDVNAQCSFPNGEECDSTPCCSAVLETEAVFK